MWRENEKVVHINDKPSFCDHVSEGVVHELLESRWGVGEFKEHHGWFEEAFVCDEGGFPLVGGKSTSFQTFQLASDFILSSQAFSQSF